IGLDAMWRAVGVEPAGVVGHSLGEVAAAHVAGVLTLEESARVIAVRAGLFHEHLQGRGGMGTVALPREQAEALTAEVEASGAGQISVAVANGPASTVLSGEPDALAALGEYASERGIRCRHVEVDFAAHGAQVEALR